MHWAEALCVGRAVIKGHRQGISPGYYEHDPWLLVCRRSLERQSLCSLVNPWWNCNILANVRVAVSTTHDANEVGRGQSEAAFAAHFSSAFWWCFTSAFSIPSYTVHLRQSWSPTATSQLLGSISQCLLEPQSGAHVFPDSCPQLFIQNFLGNTSVLYPKKFPRKIEEK